MKELVLSFLKRLKKKYKEIQLKIDCRLKPLRIILGAGGLKQKGWISTEQKFLDLLREETWRKYFKPNSIDAILAEHVWEHLDDNQGVIAAKICYKYLKKNGYLRIAVPDGYHPSDDYIQQVKPKGTGSGAEDHKVLYNYISLKKLFENIGFKINLLEYFDKKNQFHFTQWDPNDGFIMRSKRFDKRNQYGKLLYTSIILDAIKP